MFSGLIKQDSGVRIQNSVRVASEYAVKHHTKSSLIREDFVVFNIVASLAWKGMSGFWILNSEFFFKSTDALADVVL